MPCKLSQCHQNKSNDHNIHTFDYFSSDMDATNNKTNEILLPIDQLGNEIEHRENFFDCACFERRLIRVSLNIRKQWAISH